MFMFNFSHIVLSVVQPCLFPNDLTALITALILRTRCTISNNLKPFNKGKSCSFRSLSFYFKHLLVIIWFRIFRYIRLFLAFSLPLSLSRSNTRFAGICINFSVTKLYRKN